MPLMKNFYTCLCLLASLLISDELPAQCNNVTSGGTVNGDQTFCYIYNPSVITNVTFPSGGTGTLEYQWQVSSNSTTWNNIVGATLQSYDPSTITSTTYYRRTARRAGCSTYAGISNMVTKTINPMPAATITAGGPTNFCSPGSVTLTANAAAGTTYQWQKNLFNITGATLQTYVATASGSYTCQKTITA